MKTALEVTQATGWLLAFGSMFALALKGFSETPRLDAWMGGTGVALWLVVAVVRVLR